MSKLPQRVAILAHVLSTVPAQDLEEYFNNHKSESLLFIGHPLFYHPGRPGSHYRLFRQGKQVRGFSFEQLRWPPVVNYLKDTLLSLFWLLRFGPRWDVVIALDSLNCLAALFLKKIGLVDTVVYYCIDFIPERFSWHPLNNLYHWIEEFSVEHADAVWNVSPRIAEARERFRGFPQSSGKQLYVPIGIWYNRVPRRSFSQINPHTLVYAGGLVPHQGVQHIIAALPLIVKHIPDVSLRIMGIGTYEDDLKKQVQELGLENRVVFLGYKESLQEVEEELCQAGVAIALYDKSLDKWSTYADPSKMKSYLAAGLPVITTDVTHFASILEERDCGRVVSVKPQNVARSIIEILQDPKLHRQMRENAVAVAADYDWDAVFTTALQASLTSMPKTLS